MFSLDEEEKERKKGVIALKLDMSKAYDIVECSFVVGVLEVIGFPERMVKLIRRCISSVSYQFLINGQPDHKFSPKRRLCQRTPPLPLPVYFMCKFSLWVDEEGVNL